MLITGPLKVLIYVQNIFWYLIELWLLNIIIYYHRIFRFTHKNLVFMSEMTENTQKCSFRATGTSSCTFFIKSNFFCHFSSRYMSMVVYKDLQIQISNFLPFEDSLPWNALERSVTVHSSICTFRLVRFTLSFLRYICLRSDGRNDNAIWHTKVLSNCCDNEKVDMDLFERAKLQ